MLGVVGFGLLGQQQCFLVKKFRYMHLMEGLEERAAVQYIPS